MKLNFDVAKVEVVKKGVGRPAARGVRDDGRKSGGGGWLWQRW